MQLDLYCIYIYIYTSCRRRAEGSGFSIGGVTLRNSFLKVYKWHGFPQTWFHSPYLFFLFVSVAFVCGKAKKDNHNFEISPNKDKKKQVPFVLGIQKDTQ